IRHGVRTEDDDTRISEMPAFGGEEDATLTPEQIADVAEFVLSLSKRATDGAASARGAPLYKEHCASCHGETGRGDREQGAPRLDDAIWLRDGSKAGIVAQIARPNMGAMPAWRTRLDAETIKMLAVYVHALGGGE
ncbi:MAG: c-type cytochrome, partial [Rhodospirillaceae bacterium]|nr:c-type cytochrome [Rhodospirillaceae bacterium]